MYMTRLHIPAASSKKKTPLLKALMEKTKDCGGLWWNSLVGPNSEESRKPLGLRLLLLIILIVGFAFSCVHVYFLINRYAAERSRTIVERSDVDARLSGVQMPAVIVCSMNWVNRKKLRTLFGLDTDDPTFVYMRSVQSRRGLASLIKGTSSSVSNVVLQPSAILLPLENMTQFNETYSTIKKRWQTLYPSDNPYSDQAFLSEIGFKCNEAMRDCMWNGYTFDCCKDPRPVFTSYGQCFLLKVPRTDELAPLAPQAGNQIVPGPDGGLSIRVLTDKRSTAPMAPSSTAMPPSSSSGGGGPSAIRGHNGTVIYLADPSLLSSSDRSSAIAYSILNPIFAPANSHALVRLQAIERTAQTFESGVQSLKYFSSYGEDGCEIECRINASVDVFGCVMQGDAAGAVDAPICDVHDFHEHFLAAATKYAPTVPPSTTAPVTQGQNQTTTTTSTTVSPTASYNATSSSTTTKKPLSLTSSIDYVKIKTVLDEQYHFSYVNCTRKSCPTSPTAQTSWKWNADVTYSTIFERDYLAQSDVASNASADNGIDFEEFSRITVFYPKLTYEAWLIKDRYSIFELLSFAGGALALWAGISVVTIVQLISYCLWVTVVTCCKRESTPGTPNPPTTPMGSMGPTSARGIKKIEEASKSTIKNENSSCNRTRVHQLSV